MSKIYLIIGEEQMGPYSPEEIKKMVSAGEVSTDTLCWEEGMSEWQAVGKRPDQRPAPTTIAPPRRPKSDGLSTVDFKDTLDRKKGELSARNRPFTVGKAIMAFVLFFAFLTLLIVIFGRTLPDVQKRFDEQTGNIDLKSK